jgi:hypothetical protein
MSLTDQTPADCTDVFLLLECITWAKVDILEAAIPA